MPVSKALRYKPKFDPLKNLLLDMAKERSCDSVLQLVVDRLTRSPQVALCRIWLTKSICEECLEQDPSRTECLHLVASSGRSRDGSAWDNVEDSQFRQFAIGQRKVGQIAETGRPLEVSDIREDNTWMGGQRRSTRIWWSASDPQEQSARCSLRLHTDHA